MRHHEKPPARLEVQLLEPRDNPARAFTAFGAVAGGLPVVEVQGPDGVAVARFAAFDTAFRGGVRAAVGELDGDRDTVEVVTAAGPGGGPHVKVFRVDLADDNAVSEVASFFAFDRQFVGGVNVAVGNVAGPDLRQEIVIGADAGGGPHVRVFQLNGRAATLAAGARADFFAFEPGFTGGVRVAAGELDGDPANGDELVTAAGPTGGPRVRVWRADGAVIADYFAFRQDYAGGVNVAVDGSAGAVGRLVVDGEATGVSQRLASLNSLSADGLNATTGNTANAGTAANNPVGTLGVNGTANTTGAVNSGNLNLVSAGNTAAQFPGGVANTVGTSGIGLGSGATFGRQFGTFVTPSFGTFGTPGVRNAFPINGFNGFTNANGFTNTTGFGASTTSGSFAGGSGLFPSAF